MNLKDKVIAITGAAAGIGKALALKLSEEGAHLALADRDAQALEETELEVKSKGIQVSRHVIDVSKENDLNRFAQETMHIHNKIDVLINNAGVGLYGSVLEMSIDEFKWLMDINFWGIVYGVRAFLPYLFNSPESEIVNVSSLYGLWGPPGQSAYVSSKFAIRGYSESLRAELKGTPVTVITVHPAGVSTGIAKTSRIAAAADKELALKMKKEFEKNLTLTPDEVANEIIRGMKKKQERILIGSHAWQVDFLNRLLGPSAANIINKKFPFDPSRNRKAKSS